MIYFYELKGNEKEETYLYNNSYYNINVIRPWNEKFGELNTEIHDTLLNNPICGAQRLRDVCLFWSLSRKFKEENVHQF